ncbi:MAG TPA: COX15/CtaA family protein [Pyrinomonadaceae bacterium]|nr:COX15/CtaA family protein [Pyrinomonadaceae bacterium]
MESILNTVSASRRKFAKFAWFVVAYNLLVIVWGAFVRASKSGDGCGDSYPLCNGMFIPNAAEIKTIIEFMHRVSTTPALVFVIILLVWGFRAFPRKHPVRRFAVLSLIFILVEGLIGAILVLYRLVAHNDSVERAFSMPAHLIATFILVAVLSLTAWFASGSKQLFFKGNEKPAMLFGVGIFGMFLVGISGALAALGDTLFPASTLQEGFNQDLSETAHYLIRLRILHPISSIGVGIFVALLAAWLVRQERGIELKRPAYAVIALVVIQLFVGAVNVLLLAPIWIQMIHLLLADLLWISFVLLAASRLSQPSEVFIKSEHPKATLETAEI